EEHIVRWLYFLALALLAGGLGFRLLIARGELPEAAERRFYHLVGLGAVAVIQVGILAFLLRAEDALQLPFGAFLYGDLSPLADWAHLAAASLWVGGLVQLAFVVWPLAPDLRRNAFLRFSKLATVLICILLSAGIYLSVLRLPRLSDLWTASYGQILLVK